MPNLRSLEAVANFTRAGRLQGLGRESSKGGDQCTASVKGPPDAPSGRAQEEKRAPSWAREGHRRPPHSQEGLNRFASPAQSSGDVMSTTTLL